MIKDIYYIFIILYCVSVCMYIVEKLHIFIEDQHMLVDILLPRLSAVISHDANNGNMTQMSLILFYFVAKSY
jgi:hypothetical protein